VTDLKEILAKSRNYEELEHAWTSWRDVSGNKMQSLYPQYVDLINEAAKQNSEFRNRKNRIFVYLVGQQRVL
jgi:hypothetical protein